MATLNTKAAETDYLVQQLTKHDVQANVIDISLGDSDTLLDGPAKMRAIDEAARTAQETVAEALEDGAHAVLGIGGGTGGEIALRVMRTLPITFPKVLVTSLPFDPRLAIADASIILVPTLADICGLNATLREILENTAAMTKGLCASRRQASACVESPSVGITALGATDDAVSALVEALQGRGQESTVFHSNGYGGAAFSRFAQRGVFHTIIDLTPHEMTRLRIAGSHLPMPDRFSAGSDVPRVLLPGCTNFIGLGEISMVPPEFLQRPHYSHSGFFTHVKLTPDEMRVVADALVDSLNALSGPRALIVPMGGFSNQDCTGGAIEDLELRQVFLDCAQQRLDDSVELTEVDAHIGAPETCKAILAALDKFAPAN